MILALQDYNAYSCTLKFSHCLIKQFEYIFHMNSKHTLKC